MFFCIRHRHALIKPLGQQGSIKKSQVIGNYILLYQWKILWKHSCLVCPLFRDGAFHQRILRGAQTKISRKWVIFKSPKGQFWCYRAGGPKISAHSPIFDAFDYENVSPGRKKVNWIVLWGKCSTVCWLTKQPVGTLTRGWNPEWGKKSVERFWSA